MSSIATRHLQRQLRHARHAQRQTQHELAALQQQLVQQSQAAANQVSAMLQTIHTGLLAADGRSRITLLNQRYCELLHLPLPASQYVGQPGLPLWKVFKALATDPEKLQEQTEAAVQAGTRLVTLVELKDGRVLQQEYLPVVQQGRTLFQLWSYEDVTEQRRVHARMQELSRLAEQSPAPIICFGCDGQARYANPAAEPVLQALSQPACRADRTFLRDEVCRAVKSGQTLVVERRLDGHFFLWTIVPLSGEKAANVYLTDITARRQAETQLEHNQLFTTRINDTIPAMVFLLDLEKRCFTYLNQQVEQVLGFTPAELLRQGPNLLDRMLDPRSLQATADKWDQVRQLPDRELSTGEYRIRHRDGSWRWLWVRSTAFTRDPDGRVRVLLGNAEDITERKATEEALRQSRLLVERVAHTAPNLIYIYDLKERRNVYANRHVETLLGYTEEQLQEFGPNLLPSLLPPSEARWLREHHVQVAQLADGQTLALEVSLYHRDGSLRWLRITETPFERDVHGRVRRIVGTGEDITRWKVAEEQRRTANRRLAEQNRLFRQVIDTTPHLIYLKNDKGHYLLANQATADLYGMTPEEIVGTPPEQMPAIMSDSLRYQQQDQQVIRTGQELSQEETFTRPDGEVLWFHSIKQPFVLADGSVQVMGVDSNITELKKAQLDLHQAKEAAEENARAKQNFLANMSHEIRTPLNGILGMAELLTKTPLDDAQNQYLTHIRYSADHLLTVINDILAMAQLGAGKIRPEAIAFDLREVLRSSLESLVPRAREKGIALQLDPPAATENTIVLGDPYRLRQVLLNLLSNAVKFTAVGGVVLRCLRVGEDAEPSFRFEVSDTGPGIPAHQLQEMFEPFTQASASTAREYGGSGLGLSISQGLVELMGGSIRAESHLGQGSTFAFTLSFCPAGQTSPAVLSSTTNYRSLGQRRVLLAEDNAVNQFLVESLLRGWGWTVDAAGTGADALALFQQHHYDVVLMDIQMPGMDGVEATRRLRQHPDPQRAATPVLALTAHALRGEAERFAAAGFAGYLSKPFREEELYQTIAGVLEQRPPLPTAAPTETDAGPATALYSLSGIRRLAHGNEEFVRRLAHLFIQTTPPAVRELEQHAAAGRCEELAAAAHHLKSSLDGLHIRRLHGPIRQLEACTESSFPSPEVERLVTLVRNVTEQVMDGLRKDFPGL